MVIDRTDRNARTTHDTLMRKTRNMRSDVLCYRGIIQVSDIDQRRHRDRTGAHAAIATNAHIDLKT